MKAKYILSILALSVMFIACNNEDIVREPSPITNPNSTNVYFSPSNITNPVLAITQNDFTLKIGRKTFDKEQSVNLTVNNLFGDTIQIPTNVKFAAGDSVKTITINTKNLILMKSYHVSITVDQEQTKPYITQSLYPRIELNILKEDYAPYAEGTFTSEFFEANWDQTLEFSPSTKIYRFKNLYADNYNYSFKVSATGAITQVPNSAIKTGYVDTKYGMVSLLANSTSNFNSANSTYTFNAKFTVSAGSFGVFAEKYLITKKL